MKIIGSFLDEISHDIPHQNWGPKEWENDFEAMKNVGIEEVILIRCGHKRQITYPSKVLMKEMGAFEPYYDLVEMFLTLADKYNMKFFFSTYDSGEFWHEGNIKKEVDLSKKVCEEAFEKYGHHKSFKGWYVCHEVSRRVPGIIDIYSDLGNFLKGIAPLPVMISPYIDGSKAVSQYNNTLTKNNGVSVEEHYKIWDEIMCGIKGAVDIVAFQDGHVDFQELTEFLVANKEIADKYGIECRTNTETFDRDMPIKFLPIKWDKLWFKLKAAEKAGYEKAITFEFSHFLSPNSMYLSAGHLYNRYKEYLENK